MQQKISEGKIQELREEIKKYQNSIESYKNIEREIQGLQKELASQRNISQQLNSTSSFHSVHKRSTNSHRKIKVYELQKKLNTKKKQLKEKYNSYSKKVQVLSNMEENLKHTNSLIKQEDEDRSRLNQMASAIEKKLFYMTSKCEEVERMMREEKKNLKTYENKKRMKEENIRKMRKQLKIESDQTEPDESIMDISQNSDSNSNSIDYSEEMFITRENFRRNPPKYPKNRKKINFSKKQLKQMIEDKIFIIEKERQKNADINSVLRKIRIQNRGKQTSVKHYKITVDLHKNKLNSLINSTICQAVTVRKKQAQMMSLSDNLSKLEGERGRLRGKLGIKVENIRLLMLLNEQLKADFDQFSHKIQILKTIQQRCKGVAKETDDDFLLEKQ